MTLMAMGEIPGFFAQKRPEDQLALSYEGDSLTWRELDARSNRRAHFYQALGVREGDHVAIALGNGTAFHEAAFAVWKLGATPATLSPRLSTSEFEGLVALLKPSLLISEANNVAEALDRDNCCRAIVLASNGKAFCAGNQHLAASSVPLPGRTVYARRNLQSELTVDELASIANLSPRQFSRAFRAETGQSPAKAVEHLRIEAARLMMEQTRHPIEAVAAETGFADRERMRRAFIRAYGQPPQAIRRNAQISAGDGMA